VRIMQPRWRPPRAPQVSWPDAAAAGGSGEDSDPEPEDLSLLAGLEPGPWAARCAPRSTRGAARACICACALRRLGERLGGLGRGVEACVQLCVAARAAPLLARG
jgi:hypothetical protein